MLKNILVILSIVFIHTLSAQNIKPDEQKMQWFADAKLGIFIHWGIYSLGNTSESWAFYSKQISHKNYMKQAESFTAQNYHPDKWVELIKNSGAKYAVITSKHHDGVALWDTKLNDVSIPKKSSAKRDVLTPFVDELHKQGLKTGLYFSLLDWSHPDYPGFLTDSSRYKINSDTTRWKKYLKFCHGQINEITSQYKPDLMWFDGDWEHSADEWHAEEIRNMILKNNPHTIINGRLKGYGDYETPEQNFPITRPNLKYWELCMTTNNSWGYYKKDSSYKTPYEIITIFADAIGMGGNLLLDIGPKEDGSIPEEQVHILTELGNWTRMHSEAIFSTVAGLPPGHYYGPSTMSKDSMNIYLFVPGSCSGNVVIKELDTKITRIKVVGSGEVLEPKVVGKISWSHIPGLVYIPVPESSRNMYMTVIRVSLEKPLKLYKGKGGFE